MLHIAFDDTLRKTPGSFELRVLLVRRCTPAFLQPFRDRRLLRSGGCAIGLRLIQGLQIGAVPVREAGHVLRITK